MKGFSMFHQILQHGVVLALLCMPLSVNAEGHGGDEGATGNAYEKLEPFTVNLAGMRHIIQVSITLKPATLNIGGKIKLYTPAIRHEIILLLSGKTPEQIETVEGKRGLIVETRNAANKALGMTAKNGIADVLYESFIIQ